ARPVIALRVRMAGAAVSARLAAVAALRPTPVAELQRGPAVVAVAEAIGASGFLHSSTVSSLRPSPFSAGDWAVFCWRLNLLRWRRMTPFLRRLIPYLTVALAAVALYNAAIFYFRWRNVREDQERQVSRQADDARKTIEA